MPLTLARMVLLVALVTPPLGPAPPAAGLQPAQLRYQAPVAGAAHVQTATTLAWRLDDMLDPDTLTPALFSVTGTVSGPHTGQTHVALDERTAIFEPDSDFTPGEVVSVTVQPGLATKTGALWLGTAYTFTAAAGPSGGSPAAVRARLTADAGENAAALLPGQTTVSRTVDPRDYVTLPDSMPVYTVTGTLSGTVTDTYALGLFPWFGYDPDEVPSHLLLLDSTGEPVYYEALPLGGWGAIDFKRQPNNQLSYWSQLDARFHLLDHTYTEVDTIGAGNGYLADLHELQVLPNGEKLLMIYDQQPVDMSLVISGGLTNTNVIGLVVQSIDAADDVVFEWRSWDHFPITDTTVALVAHEIDYVHGNAIELDSDGNLLISSRHLDEITKLNRETAEVMWRWGGANNEFMLLNDPGGGFYHQHDIRRLANGYVSLFDNHNEFGPANSRAVVYALDEISKTATLIWSYHHTPEVISLAMGSYDVAPDGSDLIGWGSATETTMTEVRPGGNVRLEVKVDPIYRAYRAARFPWVAAPAWPPTLVLGGPLTTTTGLRAGDSDPTLYFSWNGATEVGSYEIYGGFSPATPTLLITVPRTGFEDQVRLADLDHAPANTCAYRVRALDRAGEPLQFTNVVYSSEPCPVGLALLPLVWHSAPAAFLPGPGPFGR